MYKSAAACAWRLMRLTEVISSPYKRPATLPEISSIRKWKDSPAAFASKRIV
jgi:hypothetical protein